MAGRKPSELPVAYRYPVVNERIAVAIAMERVEGAEGVDGGDVGHDMVNIRAVN